MDVTEIFQIIDRMSFSVLNISDFYRQLDKLLQPTHKKDSCHRSQFDDPFQVEFLIKILGNCFEVRKFCELQQARPPPG